MNKPKETKEDDKKMKKKIKWVIVTIAVLLGGLISPTALPLKRHIIRMVGKSRQGELF